MNINVLKIDVLSAIPAEPIRNVSVPHNMNSEQEDSQISLAGTKHDQQAATATEAYQTDTTESYNNTPDAQKNNKVSPNHDFRKVLKHRLKQSDSEQSTEDVSPKTQDSTTDGKAEQELTLIPLQNGITILAEQKPSVTNSETVPNQPNQLVQNASTPILNSASNETLVVVGGDLAAVTENQEQGVTRQAQVTSDAAQNQANVAQAVLLTPGQNAVVQPGDGQNNLAVAKEPSSNADTGQIHENTTTVSQRVTDNLVKINVPTDGGGSGKSAEAANQGGNSANIESVKLSGQQEPAGFTTDLKDGKQAAESVATGMQQTGLEAEYRGRVKGSSGKERHKNSNDFSNGNAKVEAGTIGLNDKLNIEKIELSSGKNDTTKSEQQSIGVLQTARPQVPVLSAGQVTSDRPITADTANVAARNASANDTAAAIRDQIFQSVQTSIQQGQREITVHLNPPDLGRVSIKFSEHGKELTGLLEVTNSQTRADIRQAIPEIIRSLEESGISIRRLDVMLSDSSGKSDLSRQSAQDLLRDNSSKDLWQQLGNQSFNDARGNQLSYDTLVSTGHFSGTSEFSGGILTEPSQSSNSDTLLDVFI